MSLHSNPAVRLESVSKTYPVPFAAVRRRFGLKTRTPVQALSDVSFEIRPGEIFGLIGRNGAGKTTLTKVLATLVQPTSGRVTVCGCDSVRQAGAVRARIGLATAEERSFYWRLTIEQNLLFFARLYGLGTRAGRARIDELLATLHLSELRRRRFGELSTGNKQRVAIARAMLNAPPVLILDEPTRSLDPFAAARLRGVVASLAAGANAATILLTSHNLAEIEELCSRVAIISHGRICAVDTPDHLRQRLAQQERVQLVCRGVGRADVLDQLAGWTAGLDVEELGAAVAVRFSRTVDDDLLDRVSRTLLRAGGRLVSCDTERGTLFDVLETFERDAAEPPALTPAVAR